MSKKIIVMFGCMLILLSITACSGKSVGTALTGSEYQARIAEYVTENDNVGATCPMFYDAGDKYVVAASYFGMFILDTTSQAVNSYVDLKEYDCNIMMGDIVTEIILDQAEENIYFYNVEKEKVVGKIYSLNIESKEIAEVKEDKLPDRANKMAVSESVKQGDVMISSAADEWKISNLKFVFTNESSGEVKEVPVTE